jgi:hypothetical protein
MVLKNKLSNYPAGWQYLPDTSFSNQKIPKSNSLTARLTIVCPSIITVCFYLPKHYIYYINVQQSLGIIGFMRYSSNHLD